MNNFQNDSRESKAKLAEKDCCMLSFHIAGELYKNGIRFYKGKSIKHREDFHIQHPKGRISTSGNNTVNRMVSEVLPSWSCYPRRTRCICMATSHDVAAAYTKGTGEIFFAFPADDAFLAIAPKKDFWYCFDEDPNSNINDVIGEIFIFLNKKYFDDKFDLDSSEGLNDLFSELDSLEKRAEKLSDEIDALYEKNKFAEYYFLDSLSVAKKTKNFVDKYLHPDRNGFGLYKLNSNLDFLKGERREVWTESPCLMVNENCIDSLPIIQNILSGKKILENSYHDDQTTLECKLI